MFFKFITQHAALLSCLSERWAAASSSGEERPPKERALASETRSSDLMAAFHSGERLSLQSSIASVYCFTLVIDDQPQLFAARRSSSV